jgi:hypothetical protein
LTVPRGFPYHTRLSHVLSSLLTPPETTWCFPPDPSSPPESVRSFNRCPFGLRSVFSPLPSSH